MTAHYDVAIIGSGIAGASLATILAKEGKKVIVFEADEHPRFAVGESMILETSETLRAMAELYDIPELAYYSSENYFPLIGFSHGVKRHFSFLYHSPEERQKPEQGFQAVIPGEPYGHELHLFRQDSDQFMVATAISYGAEVLQNTTVEDVCITQKHVEIMTSGGNFASDYIVDAGGFRSVIAERFNLRDFNLKTDSRTLFTHMIDVPDFHTVSLSQDEYHFPFSVAEGTLHHIFKGGWLWVIPFNNHKRSTNPLCSVGLQLNTKLFPENSALSAEEEFFSFISRFPDINRQFTQAKSVRNWTRTGRIQYSSTKVVGNRFALLGHAAGFIDPLFSKGLYVSFQSVSLLAHLLLREGCDFSEHYFKPYEDKITGLVQAHDTLVANSYRSFQHPDLWFVYKILWLLGAYTEYVKLISCRKHAKDRDDYYQQIQSLRLVGGGYHEYEELAHKVDTLMEQVNPSDEVSVGKTAAEITSLFLGKEWLPDAFREALKGKRFLPRNKLSWKLLQRRNGFMGKEAFRKHFFDTTTTLKLLSTFLNEKRRYSTSSIVKNRQSRTLFR